MGSLEVRALRGVETDGKAVRPNRWVVRGGRLNNVESCDDAVGVRLNLRLERVHAGGFKPQRTPRGEVASARLLEFAQKVGEFGVLPCVRVEISRNTAEECFAPDVGDELFEDRPALRVSDSVEVDLHIFQVVDGCDNRVSRRQLILTVRPRLFHCLERRPRVCPFGCLSSGNSRRPFGERLVEPEVVPPLHGHKVAEPHVCKLVENRNNSTFSNRIRHLRAEYVDLSERYATGVFHCTRVELGNEQLVVLRERVGNAKLALEVLKPLLRDVENVVGVQVLSE